VRIDPQADEFAKPFRRSRGGARSAGGVRITYQKEGSQA
jgi:hypothetical protein